MSNNKDSRQWCDYLTLDNIEDFVERLKKILSGKLFTFISVNEGLGYDPDIRVNQYLGERRNVKTIGNAENISLSEPNTEFGFQFITVCDKYGVWSVTGYNRDDKKNSTYFEFDSTEHDKPERVKIHHTAGAGHKLIWVILVQGTMPPNASWNNLGTNTFVV